MQTGSLDPALLTPLAHLHSFVRLAARFDLQFFTSYRCPSAPSIMAIDTGKQQAHPHELTHPSIWPSVLSAASIDSVKLCNFFFLLLCENWIYAFALLPDMFLISAHPGGLGSCLRGDRICSWQSSADCMTIDVDIRENFYWKKFFNTL